MDSEVEDLPRRNPNAVGPSCNFDKWLRHCETEEGPPPDAFGDNSPIKGMKERPKRPTKGDILRDLKERAAKSKAAHWEYGRR
ncbi:hypothetical protein E4U56_005847 [Claviceps arundinis]|uniref:Uncharacterized protein n=1 Tax=Claviceps arundinis TaxID=1623583 RepID=A0A9P7SMD8_9HYPO|nr:hypothetical protein E4U56_005847 [Claviceps arundinis]